MELIDYIAAYHGGVKSRFARSEGVLDQQVTKWVNGKFIVADGVLYSPRRVLNKSLHQNELINELPSKEGK